jgi:hypothetical protein
MTTTGSLDRPHHARRHRSRRVFLALVIVAASALATAAIPALASAALVSADGRWEVITSQATDLVAGQVDVASTWDVFLRDNLAGTVTLVSHVVGAPATAANSHSFGPAISADGAFIVFQSLATDLVAGTDANDPLATDDWMGPEIVGLPRINTDVFLYERRPARSRS